MPISTQAINEKEELELNQTYADLVNMVRPAFKGDDEEMLNRAYNMAFKGHAMQRRKSGEPYLFHPLEVARICFEEIGLGPTAVVCAILHDVVEDTSFTLEDINTAFGPKITQIVDGLTKLDGMYNNVSSPQAENFKKVISTLVEDVRVVLIKMADRVHNMRTLGAMPRHKQLKIAAETEYIYAPLAHRLGLYKLKTEFQDIILRIQEPEVYKDILKKLADTEQGRKKYIKEFLGPLEEKLGFTGFSFRVFGRPKSISSIYNKIQKKNIPFEQIYDLFAVRLIIDVERNIEKKACWEFYSVITDVYRPIPERLKDWITTPKGNGYESLHTTVVGPDGKYVEVQIRTERMDEIAERGFAAHWKYKGVKSSESVFDLWLDNVRDILDSNTDALEFLNDFKTNLFSEEVYVFTPKGDMRILPKGATALDFAFDIHSEVGYHATSIKVNKRLVPMGYVLQNGDQVSVTTNANQKPSEGWIKIVTTGKARAKIRSAVKEERRKKGEIGKEALMRKMKNLKVDFEDNIDKVAKDMGYKSRVDLYYAIYMEEVNIAKIFKQYQVVDKMLQLKIEEKVEASAIEDNTKPTNTSSKSTAKNSDILVNGEPAEQYGYTLASCCKPLKGDSIFGFLTNGQGLKIHRSSCKNATHLLANYGYRILKAEWAGQQKSNFQVDLVITGIDSGVGVIADLANVISKDLSVNMTTFNISGNQGYFEANIGIIVLNLEQLKVVIDTLQSIEGVSTVSRNL